MQWTQLESSRGWEVNSYLEIMWEQVELDFIDVDADASAASKSSQVKFRFIIHM